MMRRRTFTAGALALTAAPLIARAQAPGRTFRIAVWHIARPLAEIAPDGSLSYRIFFNELRRLGFVEGRNLVVDRYSSEGRSERYVQTARQIVESKPDLIVPNGTVATGILLDLKTTIPVVLATMSDPLTLGYVQSLARPGGNVTGFTLDGGIELHGLRLQLLKEAVPAARRLGFLTTRNQMLGPFDRVLLDAAGRLGTELVIQVMDGTFDDNSYRAAIAALARQGIDGLYVGNSGEFLTVMGLITSLANAARLPAIYVRREFADEGGLLSYGPDVIDNWRKSAGYVARVLNGEKPGDLPIQQPTTFEVVVNLKTAKALGITLPESIMIRATEVIE